jgi:hypothetical protein
MGAVLAHLNCAATALRRACPAKSQSNAMYIKSHNGLEPPQRYDLGFLAAAERVTRIIMVTLDT